MRVLVCGDRAWTDHKKLFRTLDDLHRVSPIACIIEGEAKGADVLGRAWAVAHGVICECYPADWVAYGKAAGPIRNRRMLEAGKPDLVLAFHSNLHESKGTKNMVDTARLAGIPIRVIE